MLTELPFGRSASADARSAARRPRGAHGSRSKADRVAAGNSAAVSRKGARNKWHAACPSRRTGRDANLCLTISPSPIRREKRTPGNSKNPPDICALVWLVRGRLQEGARPASGCVPARCHPEAAERTEGPRRGCPAQRLTNDNPSTPVRDPSPSARLRMTCSAWPRSAVSRASACAGTNRQTSASPR